MKRLLTLLLTLLLASCAGRPAAQTVQESYDAYWAPTFSKPLHFIAEKTDQGFFLTKQRYRGAGGYSPVKTRASTRRMTPEQWRVLQKFLAFYRFWSPQITSGDDPGQLDATDVIVSARRGKEAKRVRQYGRYDPAIFHLALKLDGMWTGRPEP